MNNTTAAYIVFTAALITAGLITAGLITAGLFTAALQLLIYCTCVALQLLPLYYSCYGITELYSCMLEFQYVGCPNYNYMCAVNVCLG